MAKWDLEDIYRFKDTEKLIKDLTGLVKRFKSHRKKLNSKLSVDSFMKIMKEKEKIAEISSELNGYAALSLTENTSDAKKLAHETKIDQLLAELGNEMIFFSLWFKDLDDKAASRFIKSSGGYRYVLESLRKTKPYMLKEKEEQIINLKDLTGCSAFVRMYNIVTNKFRFDWNGKNISQEELTKYYRDPKKDVRRSAYIKVLGTYKDNEDVLGEIYKNIANDWKNENINLRKFNSPISVRNIANDLPDEAVDALLKVIKKNAKLFQEYFRIKAKLCKIKSMERFDVYAPYSKEKQKYDYDSSKKIVLETYKNFDEKAYLLAKQIFDENHVFSEMTENKQSGAFCSSITNRLTPFILLNHMNKRRDLFTMMHEFGHGIHSLCAKDKNIFSFHASLPLAETASTFGENLLASRLIAESSDDEKIDLLMDLLDNQYATVVRQAYFVMFEKTAHEMIADNAELNDLNDAYLNNLKEQFGSSVKVDDIFKHEWKYIPHIYHTPFYCYAYSFGNLLVLALFEKYKKEGKSFVPKFFKILSYGGSEAPAKILKEVGFDITKESFWQLGFDVISEEIKLLKKLTKS